MRKIKLLSILALILAVGIPMLFAQTYLSTDRAQYFLNESVKLSINTNYTDNLSLFVSHSSDVYNYRWLPTGYIIFNPKEQGGYAAKLINNSDSTIINQVNFTVLGQNESPIPPIQQGAYQKNDSNGIILLNQTEYFVGETALIHFSREMPEDYRLVISTDRNLYQYLGLSGPEAEFILSEAGNYSIQIFGKDNAIIDSRDITAINEKKEEIGLANQSNEMIEDNISTAFIKTDKQEYAVGENVAVTFENTNNTGYELSIGSGSSRYTFSREKEMNVSFYPTKEGDYIASLNKDGKELYSISFSVKGEGWSRELGIGGVPSSIVLAVGDYVGRKFSVKNNKGGQIANYDMKFYKHNTSVSQIIQNESYDVELIPTGHKITKIKFNKLAISGNSLTLGIDDIPENKIRIGHKKIMAVFAVDPTELSFTNGSVTSIASGTELWKCKDWNFTEQQCHGAWEKIMKLVPGEEYSFTLTPDDPGYAETGVASINTRKPIYYPNETAEIVIVILDKEGHLVSNATIHLNITSPEGMTYPYSTLNNEISETERGIYGFYFESTFSEGEYLLAVQALGENIDGSMLSYFTVKQYYEFDIIRDTPVTTDPWRGPFTSSIRIVSYTDEPMFNFSEALPINFEISNTNNASIEIKNNKKIITWQNLVNNSEVSYSALPPLVTPELYEIQSYVSYGAQQFNESRPWYLAVDPYGGVNVSSIAAVDVALCPLTNTSFVISWIESGADPNDRLLAAIYDTNGTIRTGPVVVNDSMDTKSRIACAPINTTQFILAWVNGPTNDVFLRMYNTQLTSLRGPTSADTNAGTNTDISLTVYSNTYALLGYADDNDNDFNYLRLNYNTWALGAEYNVDGGMAPETTLSNLAEVHGLNASRIAHLWFDDNTVNDLLACVSDGNNVKNIGDSIIDNGVGETAMVSGTAMRGDRIAYGYYDSSDLTVRISVDDFTGTARTNILSGDVIDSNASGCRGIATSEVEVDGSSMAVIAWHDGKDNTIKAGVYNYDGTQYTAPFNVTKDPDDVYRLLDVMGAQSLRGVNICNGTFIIAYTNSTNILEFKRYRIDGNEWHGICNLISPNVTLKGPANNSLFSYTNINFTYNVTSPYGLSNCSLWTNESGWGQKQLNPSAVANGGLNWINETFESDGDFAWNIECFDIYSGRGISQFNYTVKINTRPDISGAVTNDGPKKIGETITFSGSCTNPGDSFRLIVCNSSAAYCNASTPVQFKICEGINGTSTSPECSLESNSNHAGTHTGDNATCCDDSNLCDSVPVSVNTWKILGAPVIAAQPSDQGSSSSSPTQAGGDVKFNLTATDPNGDKYYILVCPTNNTNVGQGDCDFGYNRYCWSQSDMVIGGVEAACNYTTQIGVDTGNISWYAFACDNETAPNILCSAAANGTGTTGSPFYVNNDPTWTSAISNQSYAKLNDAVLIGSTGATDSENDNLKLQCGDASGNYNLCQSSFGPGQRNCSFNFDWNDNIIHNIYCILNDSFSISIERTAAITADNIIPSIIFAGGTESNNSIRSRNWIYANVTVNESNEKIIFFYLYNLTDLINATNYTTSARSINFSNLDSAEKEYWYNATIIDQVNLQNSTQTWKIILDTLMPRIQFSGGTENNNSYFNRNWIYANVSIIDGYQNITGFYLYNSSFSLIINVNYTNGITFFNFTSISDTNQAYYYNTTHSDQAGNLNSTTTRKITLDSTPPQIDFAGGTETSGAYMSRNWIYINVSAYDINEGNVTFYLFNSSLDNTNTTTLGRGNRSINFTNLADGTYYYNITITDKALNQNSTGTRSITLDTTLPVVGLVEPQDNSWDNYGIVQFSYTSIDENSEACELWGNFSGQWGYNQTDDLVRDGENLFSELLDLPEGTYLWNVRCNDSAGNIAWNATNFTINIDKTPPAVGLLTPPNASYDSDGLVEFNYSLSESNEEICQLWGNFSGTWQLNQTDTSPRAGDVNNFIDILNLSDGTYIWNIWCNDSAGNFAWNATNWTFYVDKTVPSISLNEPLNNTWDNTGNIIFRYTPMDSNSILNCSLILNGAINTTNYSITSGLQQNFSLLDIGEGSYEWAVNCTDIAGNVGTNESLRHLYIDKTNPALSLAFPINYYNTSNDYVNFNFSVTDNMDTNLSCNLTIDGKVNQSFFEAANGTYTNRTVTGFAEGNHTWNISCWDNASNLNATQARLFTTDLTAPEVSLISPMNNTLETETNTIIFEYNVSDYASKAENCSLIINKEANGELQTNIIKGVSQYFTRSLANGQYNWSINCTDTVGRIGESSIRNITILVTVDTTPPIIDLLSPSINQYLSNNTLIFIYNPQDSTGIGNCSLYINGTFNQTNSTRVINNQNNNFTVNITDGYYNWSIRCYDNSTFKNLGNSSTWNFTVDTIAPTAINLVSPQNNTISSNTLPLMTWQQTNEINFYNYHVEIDDNPNFGSVNYNYYTYDLTDIDYAASVGADTAWYWRVIAIDNAGNNYTTLYYKYITDNTNPAVILNSPSDNSWNNSASIIFSYTATDTYLKNCSLYGNFSGVWQLNQTNTSVNSGAADSFDPVTLADGLYKWNVQCYDNASNSGWNANNYTLKVDTSKPAVTLNLPIDYFNTSVNSVIFNFTPSDNLASTLLCNLTIDGFVNQTISSISNGESYSTSISDIADGLHVWNVTCADEANNTNTSLTRRFTVDMAAPIISLQSPENSTTYDFPQIVIFNYNVSDITEVANCSLIFNNQINQTNSTITREIQQSFAQYMDGGIYNWSVNCSDSVGRTGASINYLLTIAPPVYINPTAPDYDTAIDRDKINPEVNDNISLVVELSNGVPGQTVSFYANLTDPSVFGETNILLGTSQSNSSGHAVFNLSGINSVGNKLYAGNYTWWAISGIYIVNGTRTFLVYGGLNASFRFENELPNLIYGPNSTAQVHELLKSLGPESDAELNQTYLAAVNTTFVAPNGTNYSIELVDPDIFDMQYSDMPYQAITDSLSEEAYSVLVPIRLYSSMGELKSTDIGGNIGDASLKVKTEQISLWSKIKSFFGNVFGAVKNFFSALFSGSSKITGLAVKDSTNDSASGNNTGQNQNIQFNGSIISPTTEEPRVEQPFIEKPIGPNESNTINSILDRVKTFFRGFTGGSGGGGGAATGGSPQEQQSRPALPDKLRIRDSKGKNMDYDINLTPNEDGRYNLNLNLDKRKIKKINFYDLNIEQGKEFALGIEEAPQVKIPKRRQVYSSFSIDPSGMNFSTAVVSSVASGTELWKCKDWNFTTQTCYGSWEKLMNIIPGEEYSFTLTPDDPGYAETGVASINTRKPIYHPNETAEIVIVVLDTKGHLVSGADVYLNITTPGNNSRMFTTSAKEIVETQAGIYEINYSDTALEGNYSLFVYALGNNINNSMTSYFTVQSSYEFDILRDTPVTTDPWKGPFTSSIRVISYTDAPEFNFTESLPISFEIYNTDNASIQIQNNRKIITWQNLVNNSEVSYSALPPLVTPELYEIQSYVSYGSGWFDESRPWYFAVDPAFNEFFESFEDGVEWNSWSETGEGLWRITTGLDSLIDENPGCPAGTKCAMSDACDAPNCVLRLTNSLNLSKYSGASLSFKRWVDNGLDANEFLSVEAYYNNSWRRIFNWTNGAGDDDIWHNETWNISSTNLADNFSIRFTSFMNGGAEDVAIDAINVTGIDNPPNVTNLTRPANGTIISVTPVDFNFTVYDEDFSLRNCTLWANFSGAWQANASRLNVVRNVTTNITAAPDDGTYKWNIQCFDSRGQEDFFDINYTVTILAPPDISSGNVSNDGPVSENNLITFNTTCSNPGDTFRLLICNSSASYCNASTPAQYIICNGTHTASSQVTCAFNATPTYAGTHSGDNATCCDDGNLCDAATSRVSAWTVYGAPVAIAGPSDQGSSSTNVTMAGDAINFTATAKDPNSDATYKMLVCNNSLIPSGPATCEGGDPAMFCSAFADDNAQASCNFADTNGLSGNYSWWVFLCDAVLCSPAYNGTGIGGTTASPFYINNKPTMSNITSNDYIIKSGDTVIITSVGAADQENDNLKLQCGNQSGNYSLCEGTFGTGQRQCDFISPWNDNAAHTIYCVLNDSFSISLTNQTIITSDNINPSVGLIAPGNATYDTDGILQFNYTLNEAHAEVCELWGNFNGTWQINQTSTTPISGQINEFSQTLNLTDETYIWNVWCNDSAGNSAFNATNFTFSVDTHAPAVILHTPGDGDTWETAQRVDFYYEANDAMAAISNCTLIINGSIYATDYVVIENDPNEKINATLADGTYNWSINCTDINGWTGNSSTRGLYVAVANNPPAVTLLIPSANTYLNTNNITFYYNITDDKGIINCSMYFDGIFNQTNSSTIKLSQENNFSINEISNGGHNWTVECIDNAEQSSKPSAIMFYVDLLAPTVSLASPGNNSQFTESDRVLFKYNVTDNLGTALANCSLYINGIYSPTMHTNVAQNLTQTFMRTLVNQQLYWNVGCFDNAGNYMGSSVYNLTVNSTIKLWNNTFDLNDKQEGIWKVNTNAIARWFYPASLDNTRNLTLDKSPPNISLISPIQDYNTTSTTLVFTYNASDIYTNITSCSLIVDGQVTQTNYSILEGENNISDTLNYGQHNWSINCTDYVGNTGNSSTRQLNIRYKDLAVFQSGITFSKYNPVEGEQITINATIFNLGTEDITENFYVNFTSIGYYGRSLIDEVLVNGLNKSSNTTVSAQWTASIGNHTIEVFADARDNVAESNESNNYANNSIFIPSYQLYYGDISADIILDNSINLSILVWQNETNVTGNIFVADSDSNVNWLSLKALSRNLSNQSAMDDFSEADTALNITMFSDSINSTYTYNGAVKHNSSFIVYGPTIGNVPIVNSTNSSNFATGILWDFSDANNGGYNGTQDLVFITSVNQDKQGMYGNYDYELKVPANLRKYIVPDSLSTITFYVEIE